MKTKGINHLALVCRDMAETVAFYEGALGMPLVKTVALPDGGQHFFFDCGGGSLLAFFWWAPWSEIPWFFTSLVATLASRIVNRRPGAAAPAT